MSIGPYERVLGLLRGTAVADALGLPVEGLSRRRVRKFHAEGLGHRFIFGRGMTSDDTDHTMFVAECMLAHPDSPERFAGRLAWCMRLWLISLPAGLGSATMKSILRLWCGIAPSNSGVASAGNGPGMRAAVIGAVLYKDTQRLAEYLRLSTLMTHTDPRALVGARAVAEAAAWVMREGRAPSAEEFRALLGKVGPKDSEWTKVVDVMIVALRAGQSVEQLAGALGQAEGVSGYIYHTVPVALYAWLRHYGDYGATVRECILLGGDTDTVAAIAGGLAGAVTGVEGIPEIWREGLLDAPRNRDYYEALARGLTGIKVRRPGRSILGPFFGAYFLRNLVFLGVLYPHLARRIYWKVRDGY